MNIKFQKGRAPNPSLYVCRIINRPAVAIIRLTYPLPVCYDTEQLQTDLKTGITGGSSYERTNCSRQRVRQTL